MFVKCPRCHSLVATDAVTGAPPEYCPYCDSPIAGNPELAEETRSHDDASASSAIVEASDDGKSQADSDTASDEIPDAADETVADETDADVIDIAAAETIVAEPIAEMEAQSTASAANVSENEDEPAKQDEPAPAVAAAATSAKPRKKRAAPSFARRPAQVPDRPTPRWFWAIAAGLALLAGLQIVLADRAQLASDARWRPLIVSACEALHCSVPPWREPGAFAMLGRDVRQHPYMPGALRVDATFRNNARWAQPWPELVLTLSDVDGRALGMRTFSPQEYLGKKVTQKEIASGQSVAIRMEVMEPAAGVVSFSFDFR